MTFMVTYRGRDGAMREERIEAAGRAECVAECRRRGIAPVSIAERGSAMETGSGLRRTSRRGARARGRRWVAAVVIAVAIVSGVWWGVGMKRRDTASPRDGALRTTHPAKRQEGASPKGAAPKAESPAVATNAAPARKEIVKPSFMGKVPYEEMTSDQKMERARYLARLALRDNKFGVDVQTADPNDRPMLTNAVHMSFVKYMQPGTLVPPPMLVSDKEAYAACSVPVNYDEGDSEEVLLWKSQVEEQLKEMKAYMDEGHSAMEYYELLDRRQQTEAATMDEARRTIYALAREGKYEEAEETVEAFNKYLKEKGLPTIRLSPRVRHELRRRRGASGAAK